MVSQQYNRASGHVPVGEVMMKLEIRCSSRLSYKVKDWLNCNGYTYNVVWLTGVIVVTLYIGTIDAVIEFVQDTAEQDLSVIEIYAKFSNR